MPGTLGAPTTRTELYAEEEQRRDPPQIGRLATGEAMRCARRSGFVGQDRPADRSRDPRLESGPARRRSLEDDDPDRRPLVLDTGGADASLTIGPEDDSLDGDTCRALDLERRRLAYVHSGRRPDVGEPPQVCVDQFHDGVGETIAAAGLPVAERSHHGGRPAITPDEAVRVGHALGRRRSLPPSEWHLHLHPQRSVARSPENR